jgi:hypothetical protein
VRVGASNELENDAAKEIVEHVETEEEGVVGAEGVGRSAGRHERALRRVENGAADAHDKRDGKVDGLTELRVRRVEVEQHQHVLGSEIEDKAGAATQQSKLFTDGTDEARTDESEGSEASVEDAEASEGKRGQHD